MLIRSKASRAEPCEDYGLRAAPASLRSSKDESQSCLSCCCSQVADENHLWGCGCGNGSLTATSRRREEVDRRWKRPLWYPFPNAPPLLSGCASPPDYDTWRRDCSLCIPSKLCAGRLVGREVCRVREGPTARSGRGRVELRVFDDGYGAPR